jgi:hypothetical protein
MFQSNFFYHSLITVIHLFLSVRFDHVCQLLMSALLETKNDPNQYPNLLQLPYSWLTNSTPKSISSTVIRSSFAPVGRTSRIVITADCRVHKSKLDVIAESRDWN